MEGDLLDVLFKIENMKMSGGCKGVILDTTQMAPGKTYDLDHIRKTGTYEPSSTGFDPPLG